MTVDNRLALIRDDKEYKGLAEELVCRPNNDDACEKIVDEMIAKESSLADNDQKIIYRQWLITGLDGLKGQSVQIQQAKYSEDSYVHSEPVINNWQKDNGGFGLLVLSGVTFDKFSDYVDYSLSMAKKGIAPQGGQGITYPDWAGVPPLPTDSAKLAKIQGDATMFRLYNQAMLYFGKDNWNEEGFADKIADAVISAFEADSAKAKGQFIANASSPAKDTYAVRLEDYPTELFAKAPGDKTKESLKLLFFDAWLKYRKSPEPAVNPVKDANDYVAQKGTLATKLIEKISKDVLEGKSDDDASRGVDYLYVTKVKINSETDITPKEVEVQGKGEMAHPKLLREAGGDSIWRRLAIGNIWAKLMAKKGYTKDTEQAKLNALADELIPLLKDDTVDELTRAVVMVKDSGGLEIQFINKAKFDAIKLHLDFTLQTSLNRLVQEAMDALKIDVDKATDLVVTSIVAKVEEDSSFELGNVKAVKGSADGTLKFVPRAEEEKKKVVSGKAVMFYSHDAKGDSFTGALELDANVYHKDNFSLHVLTGVNGRAGKTRNVYVNEAYALPISKEATSEGFIIPKLTLSPMWAKEVSASWSPKEKYNQWAIQLHGGFLGDNYLSASPDDSNAGAWMASASSANALGIGASASGEIPLGKSDANRFRLGGSVAIGFMDWALHTGSSDDYTDRNMSIHANIVPEFVLNLSPSDSLVLGASAAVGTAEDAESTVGGVGAHVKYGHKINDLWGVSLSAAYGRQFLKSASSDSFTPTLMFNYKYNEGNSLSFGVQYLLNIQDADFDAGTAWSEDEAKFVNVDGKLRLMSHDALLKLSVETFGRQVIPFVDLGFQRFEEGSTNETAFKTNVGIAIPF